MALLVVGSTNATFNGTTKQDTVNTTVVIPALIIGGVTLDGPDVYTVGQEEKQRAVLAGDRTCGSVTHLWEGSPEFTLKSTNQGTASMAYTAVSPGNGWVKWTVSAQDPTYVSDHPQEIIKNITVIP